MNDALPVLQVDGLRFAYGAQPVFAGWSACLGPGPALVRGGEGHGKSTLLRLLAGALPAGGGCLVLRGTGLAEAPQAYRQQVFWEDPRSNAIDALTVRAWLQSLPALHPAWDAPALTDHVQGFGLEPHLDKAFYMLSTGSRRKVLIAAALASRAALTLIDEPVGGLDRASVLYLQQALARTAGEQRAVVVAHYEALPGVPWAHVLDLPEA